MVEGIASQERSSRSSVDALRVVSSIRDKLQAHYSSELADNIRVLCMQARAYGTEDRAYRTEDRVQRLYQKSESKISHDMFYSRAAVRTNGELLRQVVDGPTY